MSPNINIILIIDRSLMVSQGKREKTPVLKLLEEEMCREYISDIKNKKIEFLL